jgi:hypothetical protein
MIPKSAAKSAAKSDRRTAINNFRSTVEQRKRIIELAAECGMKPTHYMLARALNYKPLARMTPEEKAIYDVLVPIRSQFRSLGTRIQRLSRKERDELFSSRSWLLESIDNIALASERINNFFYRAFKKNTKLIRTSSKTNSKDNT